MGYIKRYYDDSEVREFAKKFVKDVFNLNFESHKNLRGIDLINVEDNTFGIELEKGGWYGDFWENDYSLISGEEFRTVNIPIRKTKYWYDKKDGELFPNKNKHLFIRTNKKFTQVIVIKPATIKNKEKILFTEFKPNNSEEIEKWMSFRKEHVQTYNLKNDKWRLHRKK
jgi:hypothetical protein